MKLSVIIPSRNRKENLLNTLEALSAQTVKDFEVIVSDDNSTDETTQIISLYREKMNLKYVFSNLPKPHTWNAAIPRNYGALVSCRESIGLVFVDSDVIVPPNTLELLGQDLEKNSNRVILGMYHWLDKSGAVRERDIREPKFKEATPDQLYYGLSDGLACFSGLICFGREVFPWYNENIHIGLEDGESGIRLWKKQVGISYDNRIQASHQFHEAPSDRFPSNMKEHIDALNLLHFGTKAPDHGLIEASREAYASWGILDWQVPSQWKENNGE